MGYESVALFHESAARAPPFVASEAPPLDAGGTGADGGARSEFRNVEIADPGETVRDHA